MPFDNTGTTTVARQYIGQFFDSNSGLLYDNARYYNPAQGQFLSEDPAFLAIGDAGQIQRLSQQRQAQLLANPQSLNSYAYGLDNPVTEEDTNGKQAVQFAGAIVGDFIGVGSQLYSDLSTGQTSGVSTYIAAGLGGATNGAIVASGGYWYGPVGGFAGGSVQSTVAQAASLFNGTSNAFSVQDVVSKGFGQLPYGFIPGLRIEGVTIGRNSFEAIGQNVLSRFDNGYIHNIAVPTMAKIVTANIVANAPATLSQSFFSVPSNTQSLVNSLTKLAGALQSLVSSLSQHN